MSLKLKVLTVSDLHRSRFLYQLLEQAVLKHHPEVVAVVGDFLDATQGSTERLDNDDAARLLAALPCKEVVFVRGNHEDHAWVPFAEAWRRTRRRMHALHGETFALGPLTMLGFPCLLGDESAFLNSRPPLPADPKEWLPDVMRRHGESARTLWLMHEPPQGTPLSEPAGPVAGNPAWNEAISAHRPLLTISGHDHVSPVANRTWFHRLGSTVCVNVGQSVVGPLHYCVVEAEFSFSLRSVPRRLTIAAYPWAQALEIPTR